MVTCTTPPFRAAVRLNSGVRALRSNMGILGKAVVLIVSVVAALFAYAIYRDFAHNDCGLTEPDGRARVVKELANRGWPINGLASAQGSGSCQFEYEYRAPGQHYSFSVLSTWGHGVKMSWYDHSQDSVPAP